MLNTPLYLKAKNKILNLSYIDFSSVWTSLIIQVWTEDWWVIWQKMLDQESLWWGYSEFPYIYIYIHNSRNPSEVSKVSPPKTQSRFLSNIAIISHYKGGVCTIHFYIGLSRLFVTFFNLKIPSLHLWQYLTDPNPGSKGLPSGKLSTFIGPFKVTQDSASMSSCARVSVSVSKEWTYIYPWHSMLAILSYMPNVSILRQHSQCWLLEPTFIKIGVIEHPYLSKDVYIYAPQVWSSLEAIGFELCILCYRVRALIWPWP